MVENYAGAKKAVPARSLQKDQIFYQFFTPRGLLMHAISRSLSIVAIFVSIAGSQTVNDFTSGKGTYFGTTLPFRLFIPKTYSVTKKYPLVLFLHGAGERGTDNTKPVSDNLGALIWAEIRIRLNTPLLFSRHNVQLVSNGSTGPGQKGTMCRTQ